MDTDPGDPLQPSLGPKGGVKLARGREHALAGAGASRPTCNSQFNLKMQLLNSCACSLGWGGVPPKFGPHEAMSKAAFLTSKGGSFGSLFLHCVKEG